MTHMLHRSVVVSFLCIVTWQVPATAADIALRPASSPAGTVVRLKDVAEIRGALGPLEQQLSEFPLMPAPAPGTKQFLSARQIRDMLQASGVTSSTHRFTGASQVIIGGEARQAQARRPNRMATAQLRRVEDDLRGAIERHLSKLAGAEYPWQIELSLQEERLRHLAQASVPWMLEGGREPWTGRQLLTVVCQTPEGVLRAEVTADVSLPEPVVVLAQPVQRGATISAADVTLGYLEKGLDQRQDTNAFRTLDEAVGKVARRSLREGQVLSPTMIEEQTLVRRGETVKVVALAHGIRVTTFGRARQNGTQGELIYVESLDTREPFAAHVSAVREVQVLGR